MSIRLINYDVHFQEPRGNGEISINRKDQPKGNSQILHRDRRGETNNSPSQPTSRHATLKHRVVHILSEGARKKSAERGTHMCEDEEKDERERGEGGEKGGERERERRENHD